MSSQANDQAEQANKENVPKISTDSTSAIISLEVLAIIKQSQSQHGLKHADYQRYRQYCTKRLARIRKTLGFVQSVGAKNRATFAAKPVTSVVIDDRRRKATKDAVRMLNIPLICAERSWSYAMQLKQEAAGEPRKKYHMIRRFRKAVYWSGRLRDLCNDERSNCDARTKLEACAYADYMSGMYHFEMDRWQRAVELLRKAQNIYEKLLPLIDDEEMAGHYKHRVDEIKPTLRYCAFNIDADGGKRSGAGAQEMISKMKTEMNEIGDDTSSGISSKIEQLIDQTRVAEASEAKLAEIEWLGKQVFVKHDKIRAFLIELNDDAANDWTDISLYERLIFECRDCLQLLRDANSDRSSIYHYLTYRRLDLIIRRNLRLIGTLQNPADILRQYEIIIGGYNEIKQLPLAAASNFDDYLVEQFFAQIDSRIIAYKAYRCYYIALVAKQDWKESIALLDRAAVYAREALRNELVTDEQTKEDLRKLISKADGDKFALFAESISKDDDDRHHRADDSPQHSDRATVNKQFDPKMPLIEQLNAFSFDSELITGAVTLTSPTPEFRAVPQKPLFFDLALNHIRFPNLDEEINANKPKAGLTGMVKGWLGGWRK